MIRFSTAGESHGKALTAILEGIPAGLPLAAEDVDLQLRRRMSGYGRGGRMKIESDSVEFMSGVRAGETLGSPIAMLVRNRDGAAASYQRGAHHVCKPICNNGVRGTLAFMPAAQTGTW